MNQVGKLAKDIISALLDEGLCKGSFRDGHPIAYAEGKGASS